jgi:hypothetical protein
VGYLNKVISRKGGDHMGRRRRKYRKPIKLFPPHPLKDLMRSKKVTPKSVAMVTGISGHKLSKYLNGYKYMPMWIEKKVEDATYVLSKDTPQSVKREIQKRLFPGWFD